MTRARIAVGRTAEQLAARELNRRGLRVVERNVRVRYAELGVAGEIDLIAVDSDALVFVEVKALRSSSGAGPERPALAVTPRKRARLRRLARARLASPPQLPKFRGLRFDVVGITFDHRSQPIEVEWIRDAF